MTIWGDLSESDIAAADSQLDAFTVSTLSYFFVSIFGTSSHRTQDYVRTWTLASFTDRSSLSTATRMKYGDDNVYFAELTQSQLKADGKGLGTFLQNGTISTDDGSVAPSAKTVSEGSMLKCVDDVQWEAEGSFSDLVEHHAGESGCIAKNSQNPRSTCKWDGRSGCERYSPVASVPLSSALFTYVIVTRALLEELFSSFSMSLPDKFKTPNLSFLSSNDSLPASVNQSDVAYIGMFVSRANSSMSRADTASAGFWDNGVAHSFHSLTPVMGEAGNGWVGTEIVLVRLNNSYTPNAKFPVYGETSAVDASGFNSRIGYDAVVCVEVYEPWIVEIYNSSLGVPTTGGIISKSPSTDFEADRRNRGPHLNSYTRALNSTGKDSAYHVRYIQGVVHLSVANTFAVATTTASTRC